MVRHEQLEEKEKRKSLTGGKVHTVPKKKKS